MKRRVFTSEQVEEWTEEYQMLINQGKVAPMKMSLGTFLQQKFSKVLIDKKKKKERKGEKDVRDSRLGK
jgi:Fe-S cluster biosynthesis and repair protein YggX